MEGSRNYKNTPQTDKETDLSLLIQTALPTLNLTTTLNGCYYGNRENTSLGTEWRDSVHWPVVF